MTKTKTKAKTQMRTSKTSKATKSTKTTKKKPAKLKLGRSNKRWLPFALVFAVIGSFFVYRSFAATNTVSYSGQLSISQPAQNYTVSVGDVGTLTAAHNSKDANMRVSILNSTGTVVATKTGTKVSAAASVSPGTYTVRMDYAQAIKGAKKFTVTITYPVISTPPPATDTTPPSVLISAPSSDPVSGSVAYSVVAQDNVAVSKVDFMIDGNTVYSDNTSPYSYSWNTTSVADGSHTLTAKAYDASNNTSSASRTITVTNGAAPTNTNPSGQPMPLGDITGWKQVFADDFTTNVALGNFPQAVSAKWWAYPNGWQDTTKNGQYNCTKVCSVQNGVLDLFVHSENGIHYVAAPVPLAPGETYNAHDGVHTAWNGQSYGRYAVRWRTSQILGYKTAWLLWPDTNVWPRDGEIDFPEGDLNGTDTIHAFMHKQNGTSGGDQYPVNTGVVEANNVWHTTVIEWSNGLCKFYLDGNLVGSTTDRVPNTPMHWVLQTESQLSGGAPADSASGHVEIDWVAMYVPQ